MDLYFCIVQCHQLVDVNRSIFIMADVHDDVKKLTELGSSNRLGEEITYHIVSWTVFEREMFSFDNIVNEEVSYIHVPCSLAT